MTTILWSTDDENYCFATAGDAMDAILTAGEEPVGREYYSMEFSPLTFAQIDPADRVLEQMNEDVFDLTNMEDVYPFDESTTQEAWVILQIGQCIECQKKDNDASQPAAKPENVT